MGRINFKINPDAIDWNEFCEKYNEMVDDLDENDDLQSILTQLEELVSMMSFYEKIKYSFAGYIETINDVLSDNKYKGEQFKLQKYDLIKQFTYSQDRSEAENIANTMYLADVLHKVISQNMKQLNNNANVGLDEDSLEALMNTFLIIIEKCLRRFISLRNELGLKPDGIQNFLIKSTDDAFCIHIPGYLEPFIISCKEIDPKELAYNDKIPFFGIDDTDNDAIAPIKIAGNISNEKALFAFARNTIRGYRNALKRFVDGVYTYYDMQRKYGDKRATYIITKRDLITTDRAIAELNTALSKRVVRDRAGKKERLKNNQTIKETLKNQLDEIKKELGKEIDD